MARMLKSGPWRAFFVAAAVFVLAGACRLRASATAPESNVALLRFSEIELFVSQADGQPFTGPLVATGLEIVPIARMVFREGPSAAFAKIDPTGLILVLPIENGIPSGRAVLHADLRSPRLSRELERIDLAGLTVARAAAPTIEVAYATFVDGKLEGSASLLGPGKDSALPLRSIAEARFEDNALEGVAHEYFPGGEQVRRTFSFETGARSGPQRTFYETGEVEHEAMFAAGSAHGIWNEYYVNGTRRAQSNYEFGEQVGRALEWYPTGQPRAEIVRDESGTTARRWYSNGQLESTYGPDGETEHPPNGMITTYYRSGAVRSRHQYASGVEHGPFEVLYSSGKRWESGRFENGKRVGPHKKWWKNGKPALEASYREGELDGDYTRWYASGQLWERANYSTGRRDGRYQKWWKNGAVAHDYRYVDGKLHGDVLTFYDSGARWGVGAYVRGKPQGTLRRWFPDGRLGYIKHHKDGRPSGTYKRWYADGKPRLEATYVHGKLDGEFKNWLEDGSVYEFATYQRGKKLASTLAKAVGTQPLGASE